MSKRRKEQLSKEQRIRAAEAIVDDDLPDGAYFAMIQDLAGDDVDAGDVAAVLAGDDLDDEDDEEHARWEEEVGREMERRQAQSERDRARRCVGCGNTARRGSNRCRTCERTGRGGPPAGGVQPGPRAS